MAEYYVKIKRFYPINSSELFVGPFDRSSEAEGELARAIEETNYEIVTEEDIPNDVGKAVLAEILTGTAAKRSGMKVEGKKKNLISNQIPDSLEKLGFDEVEKSGEAKKPRGRPTKAVSPVAPEVSEVEGIEKEKELAKKYNGKTKELPDIYELLAEHEKAEAVVVTPYSGNVSWFRKHGVFGPVAAWAKEDLIRGRRMVGTVPYRTAVLAKAVGELDIPRWRADFRGRELSENELEEAGATLRWYRIYEEKEKDDMTKILFYLDDPKNRQKVLDLIESS